MKSKIIPIIFVLILLVFGYIYYTRSQNPVSPDVSLNQDTRIAGQELVAAMNRIEKLTLDIDFFSDPAFKNLKDLTPVIVMPQKTGRPNPFLPF